MSVTVAKLKSYLRLDSDYEDDLLQEFLTSAKAYLAGAVSDYAENYSTYPEFASKADLLTMVLATEFYQNRDNSPHDFSYTVKSLLTQLQYFASAAIFYSDTGTTEANLTFAMFDSNGNLIDSGFGIASDEEVDAMLKDTGLDGDTNAG